MVLKAKRKKNLESQKVLVKNQDKVRKRLNNQIKVTAHSSKEVCKGAQTNKKVKVKEANKILLIQLKISLQI